MVLGAALVFWSGTSAWAENGTLQLQVDETVEHDSNPLLSVKPLAVDGSITTPEAIFAEDTGTSHVDMDTKLNFNEYDAKNYSSVDSHTLFHVNDKELTWLFGATGNVDYDTTRTSELTASGINVAGIRHFGLTVSPQIGMNLTPLDQFLVNGSATESTYGNTTIYRNYENFTVSPTYQHTFNALDQGFIAVQASRFRTLIGPQVDINIVEPTMGWTHAFSQSLTASASAGVQRTYWDYANSLHIPDQSTWSYDYQASLTYTADQDQLTAAAARYPSPNGSGNVAQVTNVSATEAHHMTTTAEMDLTLSYQTSSYANAETGSQRSYFNVTPKFTYHLAMDMDLSVSYRYREQTLQGTSLSIASNAFKRPLCTDRTQEPWDGEFLRARFDAISGKIFSGTVDVRRTCPWTYPGILNVRCDYGRLGSSRLHRHFEAAEAGVLWNGRCLFPAFADICLELVELPRLRYRPDSATGHSTRHDDAHGHGCIPCY